MAGWTIRELNAGDFESLSRLILDVYSENPMATKFASAPSEAELKVLMDYKLALLSRREAVDYVAIENGQVVAECDIAIGERSAVGIIIAREMRGMGLGRYLLGKALEKAAEMGANAVIAEVHKSNGRAVKFFLGNGFSEIGLEEGSEEVLLLQRRLQAGTG